MASLHQTGTAAYSAPPDEQPWRTPLAVGVAATAGTVVLAFVNPNTTHVPLCPLKAITGLDCPFCGSLRAVHSLTRLDLAAALSHNVLFTAAVPLLMLAWLAWLARGVWPDRAAGWRLPSAAWPVLAIFAVAFAVVRNLPRFSWLAST